MQIEKAFGRWDLLSPLNNTKMVADGSTLEVKA